LQDGYAAARGDQGGIAAELDGVAQSLLSVKQHPAAIQRFPLPPALAENPGTAVDLTETPARFIPCPAALPVAQPQPGQGKVIERAGMGWIAIDRRLVRLQGLVHPAHV